MSDLWREHAIIMWFICGLVVLCGYALNCNDFHCAILIVQILMVMFCVIWSILAWKLHILVEKYIEEEAKKDIKKSMKIIMNQE